MDRSGLQRCFILGFVLCLAKGEGTCDGYSHKNDSDFLYGVHGQNITLSCQLQAYCVRATWAFRTSPVKYLYAESCAECRESFSVTDIIHGDKVNTSLHITNVNKSLAGIYDCSCQHDKGTDKVKCFNLHIKNASCQLELKRNGKATVFHNSSDEAVRTVNVNTDDNITARCVNDVERLNTNCKKRSGLLKVRKSQDGCQISCRFKGVCETRIILSVFSSTTNSPSTSTAKEEVTRSTKLTIIKTSTVTSAKSLYTDTNSPLTSMKKAAFTHSTKPTISKDGIVTFTTSQYSTERNSSLTNTTSKEETSIMSTFSVRTTSMLDQTKVNTPDDGITAIVSTTYTAKKVTITATMMSVVLLAAFIVILIFIVLVLSLKILKGKRKRSAEKEEWINPIYEGFDEGKERDGSTEHEISIIASQPDQESLDEGVYHYVVTSNNNPIHES